MLSELDKKVILALQRDLEICPRPFLEVAEYLGIGEEALLAAIQGLMDRGYIRRFGATLRHQQSGYEANALVAWAVPEADLSAHRPAPGRATGRDPLLCPPAGALLAVYPLHHDPRAHPGRVRPDRGGDGGGDRSPGLRDAVQRDRTEKDHHAVFP